TGVMSTLKINDTWSVQNGLETGSDIFIDRPANPTYMGSVKWAPPNGPKSVLFSVILGKGPFVPANPFTNPQNFGLNYRNKFNDRLNYSFESLFGVQANVPDIGTATWFGILNYLTWTFSPRLTGTVRLEFFDDAQGQRTGFPGLYTALTAGLTFQPHRPILF